MKDDASAFLYHAWLASASLTPDIQYAFLKEYETPEKLHHAFVSGQIEPGRLPAGGARILSVNAEKSFMMKTQALLTKHNIKAFTIRDGIYPASLLHLQDPPAILFYQGNIHCLDGRLLAMVGSRAASYEGKAAARKIACELSRQGTGIVSGMAGGIDTAAHAGCLDGGSPTIAVTGCGLDMVYPEMNTALRDDILKNGGLLLSEYAPGERPLGRHFPYRNRIITGLSQALVVIEARIRSGTMTSVQHALNQGKDVFVYPGNPASPYSEGNHQLLREGATYFTTAGDILEDLGWLDNHEIIMQNSDCSGDTGREYTSDEAFVLSVLKPGKLSFEQIVERCGLMPAALMSTLTMLQIKGAIEALPGKQYRLKDNGQ